MFLMCVKFFQGNWGQEFNCRSQIFAECMLTLSYPYSYILRFETNYDKFIFKFARLNKLIGKKESKHLAQN